MYRLIPKRKNALGMIISALFITCGIFLLALGIREGSTLSPLLKTSSTVLFIPGILIAARYVFYSYEYAVEDGTFTVKEKRFKKSFTVARIAVSEIDEVTVIASRRDRRKIKDPKSKIYDYRPDLFPKRYHVIITRSYNYCEEGEELWLLVSLDDRMLTLLSDK